jgi:cyclic dehypoxanthinyl futalosine synthase
MRAESILKKAIELEPITLEEGMFIDEHVSISELMMVAAECRQKQVPGNKVGWIIDRNINITNVCVSGCQFCNFHCKINEEVQYITTIDEYCEKTDELYAIGGRQLLLQGGMHPKLGLDFYTELFSELKNRYPDLKLHTLGPPEVAFLAKKERKKFSRGA